MYLLSSSLTKRIEEISSEVSARSGGRIRFEEFIALPFFGQIVLRFTTDAEEITLAALDRWERELYEITGDEFLADFMGDVYQKAGADFSDLDARLIQMAEQYADETCIPSVHAKAICEDAALLLKSAGLSPNEKVWEIQTEDDRFLLLIMGAEDQMPQPAEQMPGIFTGTVAEQKCTGLLKAALYARRNRISLGRAIAENGPAEIPGACS